MKHLKEQNRLIGMSNIIFSKKATDELVSQAIYIFEQTMNPTKADEFLDTMKLYITKTLYAFPKIGRPAPEFGEEVRKLIYQRYSILYRIGKNEIEILTLYRENLPNI